MTTAAIHISPEQKQEIARYLRAIVPECHAFAFGSRVTNQWQPTSDLDIALESPRPIGHDRLYQLQNTLANSYLPFRVDVTDLSVADPAFAAAVRKQAVPLEGA